MIDTLKEMKVLSAIKPSELDSLSNFVTVNTFKKGSYIYNTGSKVTHVYVILDGSVKIGMNTVANKTIVKEVLSKQDIFGENVFLEEPVRREFVQAISETLVLSIPVREFRLLVMQNAAFYQTIMSIVVLRLHILEERMKNFVFKKAKNRIMSFLKLMGEQKGAPIGMHEILLRLNMSHKEIALLTDTSRQTVARILGELKKDNIIHFTTRKPSRILIRDIAGLAS